MHSDLTNIFNDNKKAINVLRLFRNKVQHSPHKLDFNSLGGSIDEFTISFEYNNVNHTLDSKWIDRLIMDINIAFSDMLIGVNNDINLEMKTLVNRKKDLNQCFNQKIY